MARTGGELLREMRQQQNLSQRELAARTGTTQASISRWEREERSPTVQQLAALAAAIGLELTLTVEPPRRRTKTGINTILGPR